MLPPVSYTTCRDTIWPFGRVIPIESGVVHEIATSAIVDPSSLPSDAEGPAPESANRLWDATHVSEKSQIIASRSRDRESFQLVNMDVRFVYRIGLTDRAALQAAYQVADIDGLIENIANRTLVHDFAKRTLDDVLSGGRLELSKTISEKIQAEMDSLNSGVEILAVVVEAIHPPAGAADAYHAVQAAQISAETRMLTVC
nr:SPFH domain-containing protein [Rhizobium sp. BK060]